VNTLFLILYNLKFLYKKFNLLINTYVTPHVLSALINNGILLMTRAFVFYKTSALMAGNFETGEPNQREKSCFAHQGR